MEKKKLKTESQIHLPKTQKGAPNFLSKERILHTFSHLDNLETGWTKCSNFLK